MKNFGVYLIIAALTSVILNMFGYQLSFLNWVEAWGETNAWCIRGAVIVLGALLWAVSNNYRLSTSLDRKDVEDQPQSCF